MDTNALFEKVYDLGIWRLKDQLKVDKATIDQVEALFGYKLPDQYAEFLKRFGAFSFDQDVIFSAPLDWMDTDDEAREDIRVFYGIFQDVTVDTSHQLWDLACEIRRAKMDGLPDFFLPICESDGLPTVVYISCRALDYGSVYALTRIQIWDVLTPELFIECATKIANSFSEFILGLRIRAD